MGKVVRLGKHALHNQLVSLLFFLGLWVGPYEAISQNRPPSNTNSFLKSQTTVCNKIFVVAICRQHIGQSVSEVSGHLINNAHQPTASQRLNFISNYMVTVFICIIPRKSIKNSVQVWRYNSYWLTTNQWLKFKLYAAHWRADEEMIWKLDDW